MSAVCGYAGAPGAPADAELLDQMLGALEHRGRGPTSPQRPVRERCVRNGIVIGHLFASDTRPSHDDLARSVDGKIACAFDGLLFNGAELSAHLRGRGVEVPAGDHARLVANLLSVEERDVALGMLDGQFALAAATEDALWLARDAIGERPLYFTMAGDVFLFASEIKGFLSHPAFEVTPNPRSLSALLVFSFIPGPQTMFERVFELEAGHVVEWTRGQTETPVAKPYWSLREDILYDADERIYADEVRRLCTDAVRRRLPADGKVSAFLSGGLDSSAVVALMAELGVRPTCFSVAFGFGQPNEIGYARMVAERCRVPHNVIDVEPSGFIDILPNILWRLDDPLCDCITVPNFIMAEAAAKESPIVFNGEGGDPLFGGPKNKFMILGEWYKGFGGYDRCHAYLASYHKFYDYYDQLCSPALQASSGGLDALADVVRPHLENPEFDHFLNRLMLLNTRLKGGQNILIKVDKMLSAHGVRACSPLFDRRLCEYSFRIPPTQKRQGDVEKYVFKKSIEHLLPHPVVYRKKAGMGVPLNHWFRGTVLRDYTHDILRSKRAKERGYFNPKFVEDLLRRKPPRYAFGRDRSGELLWMLLAVELWHRVYVDGERP